MYKQGETVIVTDHLDKKSKEQKHEVGVIMISFINTSKSSKRHFVNKDLTTKLVESGNIESTIPFKYMLDNEQLPIIIA